MANLPEKFSEKDVDFFFFDGTMLPTSPTNAMTTQSANLCFARNRFRAMGRDGNVAISQPSVRRSAAFGLCIDSANARTETVIQSLKAMLCQSLQFISHHYLLFATFLAGITVSSAWGADNEIHQYQDFLTNPPMVTNLLFAQSGNLFSVHVEGKQPKTVNGYVLFRAAVQSNSWYLTIVTNAPMGDTDPISGSGFMVGKSYENFWGLTADKTVVSIASVDSNTNSSPRQLCNLWFNRIKMIQKLGLIYLEPNQSPDIPDSIIWIDDYRFNAKTERHGEMEGKVVETLNGVPKKIEITFSKMRETTFYVAYEYDSNRLFPPVSISASKKINNTIFELWKFLLPEIGVGIFPNFQGFSFTNFMDQRQVSTLTKKMVNGNKITYIKPDGSAIDVKPTVPDYSLLGPKPKIESKTRRVIIQALVLAAIVLGLLIALFALRKSAK